MDVSIDRDLLEQLVADNKTLAEELAALTAPDFEGSCPTCGDRSRYCSGCGTKITRPAALIDYQSMERTANEVERTLWRESHRRAA